MNFDFDPRAIPPAQYRERIRALETRLADERATVHKTEAELAWWRQGMELFGGGASGPEPSPSVPPTSQNGTKPVLRDAILRTMREGDSDIWTAPELIRALSQRGWMPNGKSAEHIVRSRLSTLTKANELERVGYGKYTLPRAEEATP